MVLTNPIGAVHLSSRDLGVRIPWSVCSMGLNLVRSVILEVPHGHRPVGELIEAIESREGPDVERQTTVIWHLAEELIE